MSDSQQPTMTVAMPINSASIMYSSAFPVTQINFTLLSFCRLLLKYTSVVIKVKISLTTQSASKKYKFSACARNIVSLCVIFTFYQQKTKKKSRVINGYESQSAYNDREQIINILPVYYRFVTSVYIIIIWACARLHPQTLRASKKKKKEP